jgi:hypothetical protein
MRAREVCIFGVKPSLAMNHVTSEQKSIDLETCCVPVSDREGISP